MRTHQKCGPNTEHRFHSQRRTTLMTTPLPAAPPQAPHDTHEPTPPSRTRMVSGLTSPAASPLFHFQPSSAAPLAFVTVPSPPPSTAVVTIASVAAVLACAALACAALARAALARATPVTLALAFVLALTLTLTLTPTLTLA